MIFYVKFDPIRQIIEDYSSTFDDEKHTFYLKIDTNRDYGNEMAYIHQSNKQRNHYKSASYSTPIRQIQCILIEKIRNDKLNYLINS
jgi:nitrate reductase assembly molybdenum cofactor insertion protein NarJ